MRQTPIRLEFIYSPEVNKIIKKLAIYIINIVSIFLSLMRQDSQQKYY